MAEASILLVEDDEADVELTLRAFELDGFAPRVEHARDGVEALEKLRGGGRFDLVLSDIKMPRMTGLELLERMRAEPALAEVPVVMLTSSSEDRDRRRAVELGAADYLQKPMTSADWKPVIARLRELLGS